MNTIWKVYAKKADFDEMSRLFNIDKVIARIIRNRDVVDKEAVRKYLYGTVDELSKPELLKDCDKLVDILKEKILQNKKIRIVGDYDIDGICSTVILYTTIKMFGGIVDYRIPHRIFDGYGINENIVREAVEQGIDTIITCDNGISAIEPMKLAKENGLTVLITDHHQLHKEDDIDVLPQADAVVNPHRSDCEFPFKEICGGVVALKVAERLVSKSGGFELEELRLWKHKLYELAAIATIGDVMPLLDENRILVKEGLKLIKETEITGLRALIFACGIELANISCYHIGFQIGPCLNASGRLDTALLAIDLLLEEDMDKAEEKAQQLKVLNDERKNMTEIFTRQAIEIAQNEMADKKVLVIYLPECHESIAGIIAGRVREAISKPTLIVTNGEDCLKGSARSIEAYNMFEKLSEVENLMLKFGGHPLAAGFSLEADNLTAFADALNEKCGLTDSDLQPVKWIDVVMPMSYVTIPFIEQFDVLEPFGTANTKPVFAQKKLKVIEARIIGANKNVMRLNLEDEYGNRFNAVKFRTNEAEMPEVNSQISITYYPKIDEYNGRKNIQFVIDEII